MKHFKEIKLMIPILFFVAGLMLSLPLAASAAADLSISMRDSSDPVQAGDTLTYTITVTNNGPDDALNVRVTYSSAAGLVGPVSTSGCLNDPNGTPTCNLGDPITGIPEGGSAQYTIEVTFDADTSGNVANEATVSSNDDPDPNNNSVKETTIVILQGVGGLKWTRPTGNLVDSSPAIGADGTIYVGSNDNKLYAINPADGSVKWTRPTGDSVFSSPAIGADGTIYVGSRDTNLYAINPADGSVKWTRPTGNWVDSSPAIGADGTIYVGSRDTNLYAINPDGSQKWAFTDPVGSVLSSPAIGADGTIYVGSHDNKLYAINPADGSVKWTRPTGDWVFSSPAIGADGTIYVGSDDGKFYAINPADGSQKWAFFTGDLARSSPAIGSDGTVYVGGYLNLYAINGDSGGLARSPWPMFHRDLKHTGRVKRLSMPGILLLLLAAQSQQTDLFFSEYIEGSGFNRAL